MDILVEKLNAKLQEWEPHTVAAVKQHVSEIMEFADQGVLDIVQSRSVEQETLDLLDEPVSR